MGHICTATATNLGSGDRMKPRLDKSPDAAEKHRRVEDVDLPHRLRVKVRSNLHSASSVVAGTLDAIQWA